MIEVIEGQSCNSLCQLVSLFLNEESDSVAQLFLSHAKNPVILTPVHMTASHNDLFLSESVESLDLSEHDWIQLSESLSQYFESAGITLLSAYPYGFVFDSKESLQSSSPLSMKGSSLKHWLLEKDKQSYWHQLFTECQMLLETEPLNQQRLAEGKLSINALWAWGEGVSQSFESLTVYSDSKQLLRFCDNHQSLKARSFNKQSVDIDKHGTFLIYAKAITDGLIHDLKRYRRYHQINVYTGDTVTRYKRRRFILF